jgi:hypothetical protein
MELPLQVIPPMFPLVIEQSVNAMRIMRGKYCGEANGPGSSGLTMISSN